MWMVAGYFFGCVGGCEFKHVPACPQTILGYGKSLSHATCLLSTGRYTAQSTLSPSPQRSFTYKVGLGVVICGVTRFSIRNAWDRRDKSPYHVSVICDSPKHNTQRQVRGGGAHVTTLT